MLKTKDWRLPENRIEAFTRVVHSRMVEGDLDHHHSAQVISSEMSLSDDDKLLYALLFGQSYRNHWAMLSLQLWPDLLSRKHSELVKWHNKNYKRLVFAKDTKWNLRKWPDFVECIRKKYKGVSLCEHFGNLCSSDSAKVNYDRVNKELRSIWSIGRMCAWLAQQTMYELFDWNLDHWDQQLYDSGTWSQYDSLCYLFDRIDLARTQIVSGKRVKRKPSREDISLMEVNTQKLMGILNKRIPFHVDIYNVESAECEYRKTAYGPNRIKEFTFWTTNELVEEYQHLKSLWNPEEQSGKITWNPYMIALMTKGKNVRDYGWHPDYFRVLYDYGMNLNTHYIYKDEPDAHEVLSLPKNISDSFRILKREWLDISKSERLNLRKMYNPKNFLRSN